MGRSYARHRGAQRSAVSRADPRDGLQAGRPESRASALPAARLARSASRVLRVLQIQGETLGQQEDGDSLEAQVMVSLL